MGGGVGAGAGARTHPHGLRGAWLQAREEQVMVQALGGLQGQQRGLWRGLHRGPLAHPQVHGLGLRAWRVCTGPGAAWGRTERGCGQGRLGLLQAPLTTAKPCAQAFPHFSRHRGPTR